MPREDRVNYIIRKLREERASNNEVKTYTDMDGEEWTDDTVNHPLHYNKGIETSTYIKSWEMNWNQANVVKYISRYNLKHSDEQLQIIDLQKAKWYLEDLLKDHENKALKAYFCGTDWTQTELDKDVIKAVKEASSIIDIGCGYNQYKQFNPDKLTGIDIANPNADWVGDILDYKTDQTFPLAICFGALHFYTYDWIKKRLEKALSLVSSNGILLMKVNPNPKRHLDFFRNWTWPLVEHFAELYNLQISDKHIWWNNKDFHPHRKRLKWTYHK